jgi:DNA-directed RNA polymerase specialized sigma24 family protein
MSHDLQVARRRAHKLRYSTFFVLEAFRAGLNTKEIADEIGAPEASVVILLERARQDERQKRAA